MTDTPNQVAFQPGQIVATVGALNAATQKQIAGILARHLKGDWGDLGEEDKQANDSALRHGGRLFSAYTLDDLKLWVITEADRSATTVLTPDEY